MARDAYIDTGPLKRLRALIRGGLSAHVGPLGAMFRQWASVYSSFVRRRFNLYSRGGGDWPELKDATKRRRRKARRGRGGARQFAILRDLSLIYKALTIGAPGNLNVWIRDGIRFGFGGPARHPGARATIADIARFHNEGEGNNPQRRIIVLPDLRTKATMKRAAQMAVRRVGRQAERGL